MHQSNLYMYHLDNLRRSKRVTVESFCVGICSDRQYRRLLSGEQKISDSKISAFCDKLGISTNDFYYSANEKDRYEYGKIAKLYNQLSKSEFDKFKFEYKQVKFDRLINKQNIRFFSFCLNKYHYLTKSIKRSETFGELSLICNYPDCINHKTFDFVDIVSLEIIAEIEVNNNKTTALDLLSKILNNTEMVYLSSESRHILPNIYGTVSILLSRLKRHDDALMLASSGINYSRLHSNFSTLTHLYYVKAFTLLKMSQIRKAEIEAIKCLSNAISRGNQNEFKIFRSLMTKDFGVDPYSLIVLHKEDLFS